jgi:GNAT superfamily N-acetyltransferase
MIKGRKMSKLAQLCAALLLGLCARSEFGLVYVDWLFLPEDWRRARIGSRVLAMAEEEGRRRGCTRIALTTLSVEAPGFYKKQGYDVAVCLPDDHTGDCVLHLISNETSGPAQRSRRQSGPDIE